MELFLPSATSFMLEGMVWPLLVTLYGMTLTLVVLVQRPRIVIYNVSSDQLRPALAMVIGHLDPEARWAGDCLYLPGLGAQLNIESVALVRNVQLVAAGPVQNFEGWARLEVALRVALRQVGGRRNLYGLSLVAAGIALAAVFTLAMAASWDDILRAAR
jgi:hypothetical protein